MKLLHYASVVLRVVDRYTGQPLKQATIVCTNTSKAGKWNPGGYCLFSDLPTGTYVFQISCAGYCTQIVTVVYPALEEPQIKTIALAYSQTFPKLREVPHIIFSIRTAEGAVAGSPVRLQLQNPGALLRVLKQTTKGSETLALSGEGKTQFLEREFCTGSLEPVILLGVETESKQYILSEPLKNQIEKGDSLFPIWHFTSDREGVCILPIERLLMTSEELNFSITCCERARELTVHLGGGNAQRVTVEF